MRYWLRKLRDCLWPSGVGHTTGKVSRTAYYRFAVLLLIVLAIGPELVILLDLAALVSLYEILGGALFVTAYASGAKLLVVEFVRAIWNMFLPLAPLFLVRPSLPRLEKLRVFAYVSATTAWSLAFVVGF